LNIPTVHPRIETLLATIETLTGHEVGFDPAAPPPHDRQDWDVVSDTGVRYGVLRVRGADTMPEPVRALYAQLSRVIAHEADLRREHNALEQRFRLLDRHNSELTALNRSLSDTAYRDPLTGLYRRWYFTELLRLELTRAKRSRRPLSVVLIDIDGFTKVNEELTPQAADAVLAGVASRVTNGLRACDVVARTGHDEFSALLVDTALNAASEVAARLCRNVAADPAIRVTISAAAVTADVDESAESLCERAVQAINRARRR
jgi:diguanylate cyclase (GGDEF)-like protein